MATSTLPSGKPLIEGSDPRYFMAGPMAWEIIAVFIAQHGEVTIRWADLWRARQQNTVMAVNQRDNGDGSVTYWVESEHRGD